MAAAGSVGAGSSSSSQVKDPADLTDLEWTNLMQELDVNYQVESGSAKLRRKIAAEPLIPVGECLSVCLCPWAHASLVTVRQDDEDPLPYTPLTVRSSSPSHAGCLLTVACLTYGLKAMVQDNRRQSQLAMRGRVLAQAATIVFLGWGMYYGVGRGSGSSK